MNSASGFAVLIQILSPLSLDFVPSDALPMPLKWVFSMHYLLSLEQTWEQNEKPIHGDLGMWSQNLGRIKFKFFPCLSVLPTKDSWIATWHSMSFPSLQLKLFPFITEQGKYQSLELPLNCHVALRKLLNFSEPQKSFLCYKMWAVTPFSWCCWCIWGTEQRLGMNPFLNSLLMWEAANFLKLSYLHGKPKTTLEAARTAAWDMS